MGDSKPYRVGHGKPDPAKQFKKGVVSNPYGRRGTDPVKHAIKQITLLELRAVLNEVFTADITELQKVQQDAKDKKVQGKTVLQMMVYAAAISAIQKGDWITIDSMLSRLVGKTPIAIRAAMDNDGKPPIQDIPSTVQFYLPSNGKTAAENK